MAEFTKNIQTLTQQASTSPQLQTNTGSSATDALSTIGFGLDLFRQKQAETKLGEAQQQQAAYQTQLAEGTMAFRDFKLSMKDQKVDGATYLRKEKAFLKEMGGGAAFQQQVIGIADNQ